MIIGGNKEKVISNIQKATENNTLNCKVEVGDPSLNHEQKVDIAVNYIKKCNTIGYKFCNICARAIADNGTRILNKNSEVIGIEKIKDIKGGAIVTSNHFNPLDNTVIRKGMKKAGYRRLFIVSQETNLAMTGWIGFLMNHVDIIPITNDKEYMNKYFAPYVRRKLKRKQLILIYPEQEMWFNYRKPRPLKRGAYLYAAANNVPIISCFTEIRSLPKKENDEFYRTKWILHILDPIYPDPAKSQRENSVEMMQKDYEQKKEVYEKAYGKTLDYQFEPDDIAGWIPKN